MTVSSEILSLPDILISLIISLREIEQINIRLNKQYIVNLNNFFIEKFISYSVKFLNVHNYLNQQYLEIFLDIYV